MKYLLLIPFLCLSCLTGFVFSQDPEQAQAIERKLTAAQILIDQVDAQLEQRNIEAADLTQYMLNDIAEHRILDASKSECRKYARDILSDWRKAEVSKIIERLDPQGNGRRPVLSDSKRRELLAVPNTVIARVISNQLESAFKKARAAAVGTQKRELQGDFYPSEAEIDALPPGSSLLRGELEREIGQRILAAKRGLLLDEVESWAAKEKPQEIIEEALKQKNAQKRLLSSASTGAARTPADVEVRLQSALASYRGSLRGKAGRVYEVFPSVLKSIPMESRGIAKNKYKSFLDGTRVSVSKESLVSEISKAPALHRNRASSLGYLASQYSKAIKGKAAERYLEEVPRDKKAEVMRFLSSVESESEISSSTSRLIERSIDQRLNSAREQVAAQQFRQSFKPLFEGSWKASTTMLELNYGRGEPRIDDPYGLPEISEEEEIDAKALLEETEQKVISREKELINEGVAAIGAQLEIVQELVEELKAAYPPGQAIRLDLDKLLLEVLGKLKQRWLSQEQAKRYPEIFFLVKRQLELEIRALFEIGSPGNGSGGESGDSGQGGAGGGFNPSGELKEPDLVIDIDRLGNGRVTIIVTDVSSGKQLLGVGVSNDAARKPELFRDNWQRGRKVMRDWILSEIQESGGGESALFVFVRVKDATVGYGVVSGLQMLLESVYREIGVDTIELRWLDLYFPSDAPKEFPENLRKRSTPLIVV